MSKNCTDTAESQRDSPCLHSSSMGPTEGVKDSLAGGRNLKSYGARVYKKKKARKLKAVAGLGTIHRRPLQAPRNLITCYIYVAHFILKAFCELNDVQTMCTRILSSAKDCSRLQCEAWWWLLCHHNSIEQQVENAWSASRFREAKHNLWARQRDWEHLCWQSAHIFCDYSQSDLLAVPSDRAFFRESWKIHLSCLEVWCELSFVPVGSLPPQKVVADSDSHELLFHLRSSGIRWRSTVGLAMLSIS